MIHKRIRKANEVDNLPVGTIFYYCHNPGFIPRSEHSVVVVKLNDSKPTLEPKVTMFEPPPLPQARYLYSPNAYVFDEEAFDEYNTFVKAHTKFLGGLESRYKINLSEPRWAVAYFISRKSRHYFYWAVKNLMEGVHFNLVERALNLVFKYQSYSRKLSKGTLVAYSGIKGLHEFFNEFEAIVFEREVSNVISKFAANQRRLLKSAKLLDDDKKALLLINRIPQDVAKNFIKKMTPCTSVGTIVDELKFLVSNSIVWDKEWVKKFIKKNNLNVDIVFENAGTLLLKVKDFKSIKRLGGSTSWCITRKHYCWENYYLDTPSIAEQYMLFNFALPEYDDISIIGFTETMGRGITAMHNFKNISLLSENHGAEIQYKNYIKNIKSKIIFEFADENKQYDTELMKDIHLTPEEFLDSIGIDPKAYKKEPFFSWDKESVLQTINSIDNGNHIILQDKGNVLTIMVSDSYAMSVIASRVVDFVNLDLGCQRIFRLDFNRKMEDPESIVVANLNDHPWVVLNRTGDTSATPLKSLLGECGEDAFALCRTDTALERYLLCMGKYDFDEGKEVMASEEFAKEYARAPKYVSDKIFQVWNSTCFDFANATLLLTTIPFEHLRYSGISPLKFISKPNAWLFLKQLQNMFNRRRSVCSNHKDVLESEMSELEKIMGVAKGGGSLRERVNKVIDSTSDKFEKQVPYVFRSGAAYEVLG